MGNTLQAHGKHTSRTRQAHVDAQEKHKGSTPEARDRHLEEAVNFLSLLLGRSQLLGGDLDALFEQD